MKTLLNELLDRAALKRRRMDHISRQLERRPTHALRVELENEKIDADLLERAVKELERA